VGKAWERVWNNCRFCRLYLEIITQNISSIPQNTVISREWDSYYLEDKTKSAKLLKHNF
jgi:hypothetical protein